MYDYLIKQVMKSKDKEQDFSFSKAAIYKIVVQGELDQNWSLKEWGLQLNTIRGSDRKVFSSLVGQINDQAALSGILNALYDRHMTVVSVNMLSEIES